MSLFLRKTKEIAGFIFLLCISAVFLNCFLKPQQLSFDIGTITSYREIPGITGEEIEMIEALKLDRQSFSYSSVLSPEAFFSQDGNFTGFTVFFCKLLSELFGILFIPQTNSWDVLKFGIDNRSIDFTGEMTSTLERREVYFMSHSIAERSLAIFTVGPGDRLKTERDINGLRIGFYSGTITAQSILNVYPELDFEIVSMLSNKEIAEGLISGRIDAFIADDTAVFEFIDYPSINSKTFFHLIYTPVSMTSANPELKTIISAVDKYIEAGGIDVLNDFFRKGKIEYARYELAKSFTEEETKYITKMTAPGKKINIALEHDHYPICFYNETDREFQGIVPDMLSEISILTGLEFNNLADETTPFYKILEMLDSGEISFVSELILTPERKNRYLWSERYYSSNFALISKINYPHLTVPQVVRARVGVSKGTAYEERYKAWFPDYTNLVYFDSINDAMFALERDEVDLVMASENTLMLMMNYFEKPGYMINIRFSEIEESYFGFNINEEILCSIIKKTQHFIDNELIARYWTSRIFDYSRKHMEEISLIMSVSAALMLFMLIILGILLMKINYLRVSYKSQMITLSAMFNALPDLVFCKDVSGKLTNCNRNYEKFTGLSESEIIGKTVEEIYINNDVLISRGNETDDKVINDNSFMKIEEAAFYPDGTKRIFEMIKTPLINDGITTGLLGIMRDITDNKEAMAALHEASMQLADAVEEARGANKAKSSFLAQMSHEIRTPLNAIMGMTNIGKTAGTIDRMLYCLDKISDASKHLMGVINDILDMTKIEANKLELSSTDFIFEKVIERVLNVIGFRVEEKKQKLNVNIDKKIPDSLFGDDQRLTQVITNLMGNAVKFTPEKGTISFEAEFLEEKEGLCTIQFVIKDTGIGMSAEQQEHLFEPFHQAESSTTRKFGGTGLGLSISKSIIELMNGKIWLESELGAGSTFSFIVKLKHSVSGKDESIRSNKELPDINGIFTGRNVLLAEDIDINREIVIALLEPTCLSIDHAENGAEAVKKFQQSPEKYDLILMDVQMPEMDGYQATRTIRSLDVLNAKTIPIIAMTANVFREDVEKCLESGMNDHIGKPINLDELFEKLCTYLHR